VLTEQAGVAEDASTPEAAAGAYRLLAQAPSTFLAASLDDALAEPHRPNMPGTPDRDNWSRAHATTIEELSDHRGVTEIAAAFGHALTSAGNNR
jgi:4-alpha-glucanotransferase